MSSKTITLDEYNKFLEKFSLVDIDGRRFTKMGKDFDGNYIYISNKLKFKLTPPKYVNANNYRNELLSQRIKLRKDIIEIVSISIEDDDINDSRKEEYNKIKKKLLKIDKEMNKLDEYFEQNQNKNNSLIKDAEDKINTLNIELYKIYEEKRRVFYEDKEKWKQLNAYYIEKKRNIEDMIKNMNELKEKISNKYYHSYILNKDPEVSNNVSEGMIKYKI